MMALKENKIVPLPKPFSDVPRILLQFPYPSPIEPLSRLANHIASTPTRDGGIGSLFIKRDDCNSGIGGGGNKIRKLEYVLADAVAQGADTLVTTGGIQSNHMRQTVAAGGKLGLEVYFSVVAVALRSYISSLFIQADVIHR